jgi:hypothetical protein
LLVDRLFMAQHGKRGKYARELEKIKQMSALNNMLSKGDIENALLSSGSKDSEPVNDNVVDSILDRLQQSEKSGKDMELVDKLTEGGTKPSAVRKRHTTTRKVVRHKKARPRAAKLWRILRFKRRLTKKARRRH